MKLKLNVISQPQAGISSGNLLSHGSDNSLVETEITPSIRPPPLLNILRPASLQVSNLQAEEIAKFDETKILKSYMMYNGESKNVEDLVVGDELMEPIRNHARY